MASRRQRIKAVANLPVRRPRGPGPSDSSQSVERDVTLSVSQGAKETSLPSERSSTELEKQNQNNHETQEKTVIFKQSGDKEDATICSSSSGGGDPGGGDASDSYSTLNREDRPISVGNTQNLLSISSENAVVTENASKVPNAFFEDPLQNTRPVVISGTSSEKAETSDSTSAVADVCYKDTLQGTRTVKTLSASRGNILTSVSIPKVSDVSYGDPSQNIRTIETLRTSRESLITSDPASKVADISDEGRNIHDPKAEDISYSNSLHATRVTRTSSTSNDTVTIKVGEPKPADKSVKEVGLLGGGSPDDTEVKAALEQGNVSATISSVARLGRKRFKPAVSLSAAGRRSRDVESNKPVTDVSFSESSVEKSSLTTRNELDSLNSKASSSGQNESESLERTDSGKSKDDSSVGRSIIDIAGDHSNERVPKLGLPAVTGLIPTGTAVHVQREAGPQAEEADVPGEDASVQPVTPQARTPRTPAGVRSQSSASELEDDSRRSCVSSNTVTPPFIKKLNRKKSKLQLPNLLSKPEDMHDEGFQNDAKTPDSDVTTIHLDRGSAKDLESDTSSIFSQTTVGPIPKIYEKRQRRRLEITQRLLEAKQQFQAKFGNRTPEKSRLTMFDLIFYNPTTNPMRKSEKEKTVEQPAAVPEAPTEVEAVEEQLAEERVDDPDAREEDSNQSFAMPVPQVKVGADGQIILDERSLVIETTGAKKNRDDLANSVAVLDQGIASYNAYSKNKKVRSKDWSEKETLRFYRALQTVGTDFLLMQTIFPKRSRAELKMKFKREEKVNLSLIEKALSHPLPFDLTELQKEAEMLENEENKAVEDTPIKINRNKPKGEKKRKDTRRGAFGRSLDEGDTGVTRNKRKGIELQSDKSDEEEQPSSGKTEENENEKEKEREKKKKNTKKKTKKKKKSNTEDFSGDESDYSSLANGVDAFGGDTSDSGSGNGESDAEMAKLPQVTRSGRISKPRILTDITQEEYNTNWARQERLQDTCDTVSRRESVNPPFFDIASSLKNLEPGSIVVLTTESPDNPGHQIVNVFMVGPSAPVQLPVDPSPALEMESSSQQSEQMSDAVVSEVDKPG